MSEQPIAVLVMILGLAMGADLAAIPPCSELMNESGSNEQNPPTSVDDWEAVTPVSWASREARKVIRKMPRRALARFVEELQTLEESPYRGEYKTSFPHSLRFLAFTAQGVHYRLAYSVAEDESILLHAVGPHENFYDSIRNLRE